MIETKEVSLYKYPSDDKYIKKMHDNCQRYIQDLIAFGWQPTQETTKRQGRIKRSYQIMARETSMPNYNEYRKLEYDYECTKRNLKAYKKMNFSTALLLFLIFIIPGVIYIIVKTRQKNSIDENNQQCYSRMQKAVSAARNIKNYMR